MKNISLLSLFSGVLGVLYSIYLIVYFGSLEGIGSGVAVTLVTPHIMAVIAATILNVILIFKDNKGLRISTFVMWTIAAVLFLPYLVFIIPMFVLTLIKMIKGPKKIEQN